MERDEESGLEYHSARYYLPWLGRWESSDPIGLQGGMNFYSYVKNNPIMALDPSGTDGETCGAWDEDTMTCHAEACPVSSQPNEEHAPPSAPKVTVKRRSASAPPSKPPTDAGPTIRAETEDERLQKQADEFINLDANPWDMYPELGIPYAILKGLKHSIYTPVRELISPTPRYFLNSEGHAQEYTGPRDHSDAIPAIANLALLFLPTPKAIGPGLLGEELSAAVVTDNISAWRTLAGESTPIFEEGVALGATDELAVIAHGVRTEASIAENAGASFVRIGERDLNPTQLADLLESQGWQGGNLRLLSCRTGLVSSEGNIFGQSLTEILNARGIGTTVVAPRGAVQIGSGMLDTAVPVISRTPEGVMTWGFGRSTRSGFVRSFEYFQ